MKILVNLGDLEEAGRLIPIVSAHVSGVSYHTAGEGLIKLLGELNGMGAKVSVPTSLNPAGMDLERWKEIGYPDDFAGKQNTIIDLYASLGIDITCSCIPYETPHRMHPIKFGDHISWGESNAVIYANSVVGARTNREGGISSLAAAILGKTPEWGMHLDGPRMPTLEVKVEGELSHLHYNLLGAYMGKHYNSNIVLFKGLPPEIANGDLKHLGAAMAAKGGHPVFHIGGITPEKGLIERAVKEGKIEDRITMGPQDLEREKGELYPTPEEEIDVFVLGCPQFGMDEFHRLHAILKGRKLKEGKRIIVYTNRPLLEKLDPHRFSSLKDSGVEIYNDTCMVVTPLNRIGIGRVGTDSGKAAHYIPKMSGIEADLLPIEMIVELCIE
jgi:predicted aconitase